MVISLKISSLKNGSSDGTSTGFYVTFLSVCILYQQVPKSFSVNIVMTAGCVNQQRKEKFLVYKFLLLMMMLLTMMSNCTTTTTMICHVIVVVQPVCYYFVLLFICCCFVLLMTLIDRTVSKTNNFLKFLILKETRSHQLSKHTYL